ncbi:2TM domain-containing protein [Tenacibaculum sp. 190524A02b]|uniref:2TM domain-containing protein n=1 Tax=Tenacibaculum vairaonense TaxID=3137860 RepID=A0ABP1FC42_9FLAO
MENQFIKEHNYMLAKKKVEKIKAFYIHAIITVLTMPIIIVVNLKFVPHYHWFWYPLIGMSLGVFFHWFGVFGADKLGFGKDWEEKKIQQFLDKENRR